MLGCQIVARVITEDMSQGRDEEPDAEAGALIFTEKEMGESDLQFAVCGGLVEQLVDYFAALNRQMKVGGNLEFHYREDDPAGKVVPDVYVLEDEPPEARDLARWALWENGGKAPALAVEVVSRLARKDYTLDPRGMIARYEELKVLELVRYDPMWVRYRSSTAAGRACGWGWVRPAS